MGGVLVKTLNHWKLDGNSCRVLVQLEVVVAKRSVDNIGLYARKSCIGEGEGMGFGADSDD